MAKLLIFLIATCLILQNCSMNAQQKKVVCYWNSNSGKHVGLSGEFHASNIDPTICTHIVYHHIWFTPLLGLRWSSVEDKSEEFLRIKERNSNVKLLVGIGGPYWVPATPSRLVANKDDRNALVNAIKTFLVQHSGFDGCDFDWQWPGQGSGTKTEDKQYFTEFLSTLRDDLPSKIISISVAPRNEDIQISYDIPAIVPHVDFINLNSFDLRGTKSDTETAFHSPYRKYPNDSRLKAFWNAESIVNSWLGKNVPPEKLTLGISTYGRSFTLSDSANFGVGAAVSGIGRISSFLNETVTGVERINYIPYAEICSKINDENSNWKTFWSSEHFAPYAVFDEDQWVGYDDEKSTLAKIHLVRDKNLTGINYAYVDFDDFTGTCGSPFQLIRIGYDALVNDNLPNTIDPSPDETTSLSTTTVSEKTSDRKVVCYWNSNSDKHVGLPGEFHADDIDPTVCTHIVYHHIMFSQQSRLTWSSGEDKSEEFLRIKERNSNVKLLVGIGGPNWGSSTPSGLLRDETTRVNLTLTINRFLSEHSGFDGCDIDWQWPGQGQGIPEDKTNFPLFLKTLRDTLPSKIISISVAPRNEDIQISYDIPAIEPNVDFINLNSFDLRGTNSDTETAFHSPYRKDPNDLRPEASWNVESIVDSWLGRSVPPEKLTLGIPTYGRSFTLTDSANFGVGAKVSGIGRISSFLTLKRPERINYIPYAEICSKINDENSNWTTFWSSEHFAPYAIFDEDQWVGYDDENSTLAKIHLVLDKNLGGINYAYVDFDDFDGKCGSPFQLTRNGYDVLINGILPPNPVDPTTTTRKPGDITSSSTTPEEITSSSTTTEEITSSSSTTEEITSSSSTTEEITSSSSTTEEITSSSSTTEEIKESSQSTTSEESSTIQDTTTVPEETSSNTSTQSSTSTQKTTKTTRESTSRQTGTTDFKTPPITILSTSQRNNEYSTTINPSRESTTIQLTDSTISRTSSMTTDFRTPPVTILGTRPQSGKSIIEPPENITCTLTNGNQKHPNDLAKYITCAHNIPYIFDCEDGLHYDETNDRCE